MAVLRLALPGSLAPDARAEPVAVLRLALPGSLAPDARAEPVAVLRLALPGSLAPDARDPARGRPAARTATRGEASERGRRPPPSAVAMYVAGRLVATVLLMLGVASLVFLVIHLIPGDAAAVIAGERATPDQIEHVRRALGLDRPLHVQYAEWLGKLARGDLGKSLISGRPIMDDLVLQVPRTVELMLAALLVSVAVGVPTGILAAVRRSRVNDLLVSSLALVGLSVPNFVFGTFLALVFGLFLRWLPISGFVAFAQDPVHHLKLLVMPSLALGLGMAGVVTRTTRSAMLDVLGEDYIRTARAKGLGEGAILYRHALKNSLIPVASVVGIQAGTLLGGTVIIEFIFNWPGLSSLLIRGIYQRDAPLVQGVVLLISGAFVLINLAVDVVNAHLDPRVRA